MEHHRALPRPLRRHRRRDQGQGRPCRAGAIVVDPLPPRHRRARSFRSGGEDFHGLDVQRSRRPRGRAVNRLGLSALSDTTPSGWTYKAMLSHVANWMEKLEAEMPNRLAGRRGPFPDVDAENAREADASKSRSAHETVERVHAAYKGVVDLVTALPPDRDIDFLAVRLVVGETYGHFVEHGAELEAALPRTPRAYEDRIETVWKPFRAAIRERGRAGLG